MMKHEQARKTAKTVKRTVKSAQKTARSSAETLRRKMADAAEDIEDQGRASMDRASAWASDAYESGQHAFDHARESVRKNLHSAGSSLQSMAAENPLSIAAAGLAAGFILGALVMRYGMSGSSEYDEYEDEENGDEEEYDDM